TGLRAGNPFVISFRQRSRKSSATASFTGSLRITAENLAKACANLAANKKTEEIVVLDLQGISSFTDYFVICSGTSEPNLKEIAGDGLAAGVVDVPGAAAPGATVAAGSGGLMLSNSTSKISVAFGPMSWPAPRSP